jgi:hypothetical protein
LDNTKSNQNNKNYWKKNKKIENKKEIEKSIKKLKKNYK